MIERFGDTLRHFELLTSIGQTNDTTFLIEVSKGNVPGYSTFHKFGRNPDIDTGDAPTDIWYSGGEYTGFPSETETMEIFSSSPDDTLLGTGARTVTISNLLDSGDNELPDVVVQLDGTTPVSLGAQTYHRCSNFSVTTAGSGNSNLGIITLRHTTTTANIFGAMAIGLGQTQLFAYTVPAGKSLFVPDFEVEMSRANGSPGSANVHVTVRDYGSNVWRVIRNAEITNSHGLNFNSKAYFVGLEKQDIKVIVVSVSDNNTIITGGSDGFLVEN